MLVGVPPTSRILRVFCILPAPRNVRVVGSDDTFRLPTLDVDLLFAIMMQLDLESMCMILSTSSSSLLTAHAQ